MVRRDEADGGGVYRRGLAAIAVIFALLLSSCSSDDSKGSDLGSSSCASGLAWNLNGASMTVLPVSSISGATFPFPMLSITDSQSRFCTAANLNPIAAVAVAGCSPEAFQNCPVLGLTTQDLGT